MDCELLALRHIVTSRVEHSSVLNDCMALEKESYRIPLLDQEGCSAGRPKEDGYRVTYPPVDRDGLPASEFDCSPRVACHSSLILVALRN